MTTFNLKGVITPDGKLMIDLPDDLKPGPVEVVIREQEEIQGISLGQLLESGLVGIWADRDDVDKDFARKLRQNVSARI